VLQQLVKQLQNLLNDETASKLLALYSYEAARPQRIPKVSVYHSNVVQLLDDERCFRIEFEPTSSPSARDLYIGILDSSSNPPEFHSFVLDGAEWEAGELITPTEDDPDVAHALDVGLLMARTWRAASARQAVFVGDCENNLEIQVSVKTSRMFYVENTQDFLYKKPSLLLLPPQQHNHNNNKSSHPPKPDWNAIVQKCRERQPIDMS
jgi:hypothetical protein